MRDFKFRAWDFENQEMYHSDQLQSDGDGAIKWKINYYGGLYIIKPHLRNCLEGGESVECTSYVKVKKQIIMQFTGLCDKNGKEIYEGDVVEQEAYRGSRLIGVVEYSQGGFCLKCIQCHRESTIGEHYAFSIYGDDTKLKKGEVIGNIYEHPELPKEIQPDAN